MAETDWPGAGISQPGGAPAERGPVGGEGGFVLAAAILGIVIIGALITGGFFAASQEDRTAASSRDAGQAFYIAEQGLHDVLGTWRRIDFQPLRRDTTVVIAADTVRTNGIPIGSYVVEGRRISQRLYFLRSTGSVLRGGRAAGAARQVGVVVRSFMMQVPDDRALQIYGGLLVSGNARIDGRNSHPSEWTDCDTTTDKPAIVAKDTTLVRMSGSAAEIIGNPPLVQDTGLSTPDFLGFGDVDFDELKLMAEKVYPPATTLTNASPVLDATGACDITVRDNWGAPLNSTHACHTYFPLIYAQGNLTIASSSYGQGILLVEGDLHISGGFDFYGIVVVKGKLVTTGTGAHLNGLALVYTGGDLDRESLAIGNSIINYSQCSIARAQLYNSVLSRALPIRDRSWVDLSATGVEG
ncbi:MAG: hypothetical protein HY703_02655 [Gemmatimonadetes bacterium]|nr:hypothetical protein [Gemmatimonadota bacterium]